MRTLLLVIIMAFAILPTSAQPIQDLKVKNSSNQADRTMMLDILRASLYQELKQEVVFVVKHFKMGGNYSWLMGDAQRKDGRAIKLPDDGEWGCCHVEALFKKNGGKWYIVESGYFSTDVWWEGIRYKYPAAPAGIFDELARIKND